ncbi:YkgJ family cysteine cluster protein [Myxococcota bacterium]|nr:YkgJ family cysteine cluster protein [Myxococcota bacterium]
MRAEPGEATLPAPRFTAWLAATRRALAEEADADVPCGDCTGCCTSSYFIHVRPDDKAALARIPKKLLFAAPGLPKGHKVMGFDQRGHCPMLVDGRCSIYEDRPRTCRTYDCRVFAATGLEAGEADKARINAQAARWRFEAGEEEDTRGLDAARRAAKGLARLAARGEDLPQQPSQRALLALRLHTVLLGCVGEEAEDAALAKALGALRSNPG